MQNSLEVKRNDFQQIGADLATKMIILNEKRIQILSEKLREYYDVMKKYYGSCSESFNKTNRGELRMPIEDTFGTVKFKDLIASLRSEREAKKTQTTEKKEEEQESFEKIEQVAPNPSTQAAEQFTPNVQPFDQQQQQFTPTPVPQETIAFEARVAPQQESLSAADQQETNPFDMQQNNPLDVKFIPRVQQESNPFEVQQESNPFDVQLTATPSHLDVTVSNPFSATSSPQFAAPEFSANDFAQEFASFTLREDGGSV
eukprot:TRINITY_DN1116_c0_g1_i4.p1 TRINITY_DN1116_c0_g1~~TRINITY_DN1116_c0_g1_i4.p1  ORF type:complete len:258 (+),score=62.93 TRINITY_DN1116_c0_g1_i4:118-891(+)